MVNSSINELVLQTRWPFWQIALSTAARVDLMAERRRAARIEMIPQVTSSSTKLKLPLSRPHALNCLQVLQRHGANLVNPGLDCSHEGSFRIVVSD